MKNKECYVVVDEITSLGSKAFTDKKLAIKYCYDLVKSYFDSLPKSFTHREEISEQNKDTGYCSYNGRKAEIIIADLIL